MTNKAAAKENAMALARFNFRPVKNIPLIFIGSLLGKDED